MGSEAESPVIPHPCNCLRQIKPRRRVIAQPDKTGKVSAERLRATIQRFGLMLDVDRLVREVGELCF